MASREELIAAQKSVDEICEHIGADSLAFLSIDALMRGLEADDGYCNACFTGDYPIELVDNDNGADKELTLLAERY